MLTVYLAISLLKQIIIPSTQLKIFFSYSPNEALLLYLSLSDKYVNNKTPSKNVLIDLIVDDKDTLETICTEEDNKLTIDEINKLINRNRDHILAT